MSDDRIQNKTQDRTDLAFWTDRPELAATLSCNAFLEIGYAKYLAENPIQLPTYEEFLADQKKLAPYYTNLYAAWANISGTKGKPITDFVSGLMLKISYYAASPNPGDMIIAFTTTKIAKVSSVGPECILLLDGDMNEVKRKEWISFDGAWRWYVQTLSRTGAHKQYHKTRGKAIVSLY